MCLGNSTDLENAGGGVEKKKSVNKKCGGQRHVYVCGGSMKRQRGSEAARWPVSESVGERVRARQRDGPGRPGQGGGLGGGSRNGLGSRVAGLRPGRHSHSGTLLGGGPFALGHLHHHPVAGVLPSDDPTKESWDWNDASRVCPLWPWRMARRHQQWALTGWHGIPPLL